MDLLGAHVSIAGGISNAPERGRKAGCNVIQCFTQNANRWLGKRVTAEEAALFKEKRAAFGIADVISHDIYLINLASPPGEMQEKSLQSFQQEMERCAALGIDKIVMHPGAHNGDGEDVGIRRICEAFDNLFAAVPHFTGKVLLENTAGQGTYLGYNFEQLRGIIEGSSFPERFGICIDTCHAFAAGYPLNERDGYARMMDEVDRLVGLQRIGCFHFNDSKKGLGCRVDRHEHIGQGLLGLEAFRLILNDPLLALVPKLIETPKGDNDEMDEVNLKILRDLIAA